MDIDIDEKAIDDQIQEHLSQVEMLRTLKRLTADPQMKALLARFSKNGKNGKNGHGQIALAQVVPEADSRTLPKGQLQEAVRKAIVRLPKSRFTSRDVITQLEADGFTVRTTSPLTSVNEVLVALSPDEVTYTGEKEGVAKVWQKSSVVQQNRTT